MKFVARLKEQAKHLKREIHALYLAARDPRVPWYAQAFLACVVAYALSPIDLIPDPIPILGYLDDLILLPLGIYLAIKMVPSDILDECRQRARLAEAQPQRKNWIAGGMILAIWLATIIAVVVYFRRLVSE